MNANNPAPGEGRLSFDAPELTAAITWLTPDDQWAEKRRERREAIEAYCQAGETPDDAAERIVLAALTAEHEARVDAEEELAAACLAQRLLARGNDAMFKEKLAAAESENARLHRSVLAMERLKTAFERAFNYSRTYIESERLERYWAEIEKAETAVAALAPAPTAEAAGLDASTEGMTE